MATYYVSSADGSDADNGTTWALAKATIAGALAVATADGDVIFVDSAHAETSGASTAITWNVATANAHVAIISVNRNGSTTTGHSGWLAGATATVGTAAAFNIGTSGAQRLFIYGITMRTDTGNSNANDFNLATATAAAVWVSVHFMNCTLACRGSNAGGLHTWGTSNAASVTVPLIRLENCSVVLPDSSNSAQGINFASGRILWINTTVAFQGANKPPQLFRISASGGSMSRATWVDIIDSDLSGFNAGAIVTAAGLEDGVWRFRNCKMASGVTYTTGTFPAYGCAEIIVERTDDADTTYVLEHHNRLGSVTADIAVYADGGAEFEGAGISWKIVTNATCKESDPFVTQLVERYSSSTSSIAVGFRIAHDSATDLNDRNLWPEIEYASDASFPKGTLKSGRNAQPFDGSAADWANNTDAWTGTGGFSNLNRQTVEQTFTPAAGSRLKGRLVVGATSKTLYVDPLLRIT